MSEGSSSSLEVTSAWRAGRLNARRGPKRLLFGRVYEDSAVEREAFSSPGRVFCIASAGCTALELCLEHEVVACDINPVQLDYVRRRLTGAGRELGSAERIMGLLRLLMPFAGWTRAKLSEFLAFDDPSRQLAFFRTKLDTRRFRAGLALSMSPLWLRGAYSSELLASLPPRFDRVLRGRMERCFGRHGNRQNPYVQALLSGSSPNHEPLLHARATSRLELVESDAASYLERCPPRSFSGFSLSNILDGAAAAYRRRLFDAVIRAAEPGARVILRSFGEPAGTLATNRAGDDRSMLWGIVDVRPVETLLAG